MKLHGLGTHLGCKYTIDGSFMKNIIGNEFCQNIFESGSRFRYTYKTLEIGLCALFIVRS